MKPFWEEAYEHGKYEIFGRPSPEVVELAPRLSPGARVLDAGCGDGRHALYLARCGLAVDAFDLSERGVAKLKRRAEAEGLPVRAWVDDLCRVKLSDSYDLIVCHGVLHLLRREEWMRVIPRLQAGTRRGG